MKKIPKKEQLKRQKRTQKRADYTKSRAHKKMPIPKLPSLSAEQPSSK